MKAFLTVFDNFQRYFFPAYYLSILIVLGFKRRNFVLWTIQIMYLFQDFGQFFLFNDAVICED